MKEKTKLMAKIIKKSESEDIIFFEILFENYFYSFKYLKHAGAISNVIRFKHYHSNVVVKRLKARKTFTNDIGTYFLQARRRVYFIY